MVAKMSTVRYVGRFIMYIHLSKCEGDARAQDHRKMYLSHEIKRSSIFPRLVAKGPPLGGEEVAPETAETVPIILLFHYYHKPLYVELSHRADLVRYYYLNIRTYV